MPRLSRLCRSRAWCRRQYIYAWHLQVVRRRLVLEDAAGQVEGRTVAWAQEAALPVVRQRRLGAGLRSLVVGEQPRWVQMPTATRNSGLMRTVFVARIFRRQFIRIALGLRIGQLVVQSWAATPPFQANASGSRPACRAIRQSSFRPAPCRQCPLPPARRLPLRAPTAGTSTPRRLPSPVLQHRPPRKWRRAATSTGVDLLFVTHTNPNQSKCEICTKLLATLNYIGAPHCFKENTSFRAQLTCMPLVRPAFEWQPRCVILKFGERISATNH